MNQREEEIGDPSARRGEKVKMKLQIHKGQMSESRQMGIILSLTGGFLDAYTYVVRGRVFANAQTGNVVLLGLHMANGDFGGMRTYLIPIAAFLAGIFVAELVRHHFRQSGYLHWRQICVALEILALLAVAFFPQSRNVEANLIVSFVCALQVQSFRKLDGITCATTMCTGNLRSAGDLLCQFWYTRDRDLLRKSLRYFFMDAVFLAGAVVGVACVNFLDEQALLICCGFLLTGFLLMFIRGDLPAE